MNDQSRPEQLFKYDLWANRKIADVINVQSLADAKESMDMFAHIAASQRMWYRRIKGESTEGIELWPEDVAAEKSMKEIKNMHAQWIDLIDENQNDPDRQISYQNSKGNDFRTPMSGILHHVIIHGQHHRAQIAKLLRQQSINPPATDFIFYLRENDNK